MTDTGEKITEALATKTMFTLPLLGDVKESIVTTWIVMAVLIIFFIIAGRNLSVDNPGKLQCLLEMAHTKFYGFFRNLVGKKGEKYIPYLMFMLLFIGAIDVFPIFGFKPATKDVNVTVAFAGVTIILVQVAGIQAKGGKGWLKSFTEPVSVVTPMNFLELIIKPFSLCMRLMGNMLGGFAIMKLIEIAIPVALPAIASLYFDFFDGLLQAFVFTFLSAMYIGEAVE